MQSSKLDELKIFYEFLVDSHAYETYMHDIQTDLNDPHFYKLHSIIGNSFDWDGSSNGYDYWEDISDIWESVKFSGEYKFTLQEIYNMLISLHESINNSYEYW